MADSASSETEKQDGKSKKIYCANCAHCKLVRNSQEDGNHYTLRVRCEAGKWVKKLGGEKYYKYFTVARRSIEECDSYEPMGDEKEFLRELKKTLPIKDEVYSISDL
ncbi:MAG TPA: hypothetical protein ENN41_00190 [Sediminispirochaeta sp.]|nr:hypothetical protein [Sediminispirochaeta sp.]